MIDQRVAPATALVALTSIALLAGCGGDSFEPVERIVVVTIDTLRADQLGTYGGPAPTPNLDRMASKARVFERAYAQAPITHPSLSSMWSGLLPSQHGVMSQFHRLAPSVVSVPVLAKQAGYHTAAVVANLCKLQEHKGTVFHDGFDVLECAMLDGREQWEWDRAVVAGGLAQLERTSGPLLLWLHLMDPHSEHRPPPHLWDWELDPPRDPKEQNLVFDGYQRRVTRPEDAEYNRLWALYRAQIAGVDETLGPLFDTLEPRLDTDTALIVASDHGEELFESWPYYGHGDSLSEGVLRVPLFVRAPRVAPERRAETVELLQVAPTVLDLLDIKVPYPLAGPSLLARHPGADIAIAQLLGSLGTARDDEHRLWPGMEPDGRSSPWRPWPGSPWRRKAQWFQPPGALVSYPIAQSALPTLTRADDGAARERRANLRERYEERLSGLAPLAGGGSAIEDEALLEQLRTLGYLGD